MSIFFEYLGSLGLDNLFRTCHVINIDITTVFPVPVANLKHSLIQLPSLGILIPCFSDSIASVNQIAVSTASI